MENINFIPATKLPVAEGEQVDVLCIENGEMKRKPADGLGGGYTLKVRQWVEFYDDGGYTNMAELLEGSYADAVAKYDNENPVICRVIEECKSDKMPDGWEEYKGVGDWPVFVFTGDEGYLATKTMSATVLILPDGSVVCD